MMRSSSKMITRARSVRNMGKVPFKFKFDFIVETVDKLAASGDIVVVWERSSNKVVATRPAKIDRSTRKATFENERIESELTLFKTQPSERRFQDKVFKIAVRASTSDGKTLGKIHLNLADYAEVPSGSKRISAELTNGSTIIASIRCTFLSMGKATPGKGGGKSEYSDSDEDLDGACKTPVAGDEAPGSFLKNRLKMSRVGSRKNIGRSEKRPKDDENSGDTANLSDATNTEKLRKENMRLRKQVEEAGGGDGKMVEENKSLRREIADLRTALSREPVYADVVRELKEAKMALALLHLEKEQVVLELSKLQRAELKQNQRTK